MNFNFGRYLPAHGNDSSSSGDNHMNYPRRLSGIWRKLQQLAVSESLRAERRRAIRSYRLAER
jgi:hypothetical protein